MVCLLSHFSHVRLFATPWIVACQAPLSVGFPRQENWSGLPFPPPVTECEVSEVKSLSHVRLFATPWTVAYQAPPSMGFSRKEYWSGFPCPPPGNLPNPGIKRTSLMSPALAGSFFITIATWVALLIGYTPIQNKKSF